MDETDEAILRVLATEGRASLQRIADTVGLRRPSVHARVKKLEEDGVIQGYEARLDPRAVGGGLVAFVFLHVEHGRGTDCHAVTSRLADHLRRIPQVLEFHTTTGDDDCVAKVRAKDVEDLERVVMRDLSGAPGVARVRTVVALATHFERPLSVRPAPSRPARRRSRART